MSEAKVRRPRTTRKMVARVRAVAEDALRLETQTSVLYGRHANREMVERCSELLLWCDKMDLYFDAKGGTP